MSSLPGGHLPGKPHRDVVTLLIWRRVTGPIPHTIYDTKKLTFSEEFRDCYAWTRTDSSVEQRGSSAQVPRIFRASGRGFSMRAGANFLCGWVQIFCADGCRSSVRIRVKMAETSCTTTLKDRETRRKDCSKYHYMTRTYLDMKYER